MRTTYPEAYFDFTDVTAAEDSTVTSNDINSISNLDLLCQKGVITPEYATLELNNFVLDGSREIMQESPEDIPFMGTQLSDDNGEIDQSILISFGMEHSSIGFTLTFAEQYPGRLKITCIGKNEVVLATKVFCPDRQVYFCDMNVQNYYKVVIEVLSTRLPGQYAKINSIVFGKEWLLSRDRIKTASVYEEIDLTSATLSINTAKIEIIDTEGNFDTKNQNGLWRALQRKQGIRVIEHINKSIVECGTFYLSEWSSQENLVNISFEDILGVMDRTTFYEGEVYKDVAAGKIIDKIMRSFGSAKYEVDEEIAQIHLSGYLGIQSHRAALQQVVFACGAVADCSRSDKIRILKPDRYVSHTIGTNRKFMGTTIKLDTYVSAVTISYKMYSLAGEGEEVFSGALKKGDNRIEFSEPYMASSLITSTGTIKEAMTNYVVVSMEGDGECVINGRKYDSVEHKITVSVEQIEVGEVENAKTYSGCTLVDVSRAKEIAERILNYFQLRQIVTMKVINEGECVGDWCSVLERTGKASITGITSQSLNLSGGNIADVTCRGYNTITTESIYTTEFYSGERGLI